MLQDLTLVMLSKRKLLLAVFTVGGPNSLRGKLIEPFILMRRKYCPLLAAHHNLNNWTFSGSRDFEQLSLAFSNRRYFG